MVTAVCVSVCLSLAAFPHYCMDPNVTWWNGRGVPSRCALLGSFAICDNSINAKCERVLVLALCLVTVLFGMSLLFQRLVAVNLVIKFVLHSDNNKWSWPSVCLSVCPLPHSRTTAWTRINLREWQGVPSRCALLGSSAVCDNSINAKCVRVLVLALCLVTVLMDMSLLFQRLVAVSLVIKFVLHSDNNKWSRPSVCLSVCPLPHSRTTAWTRIHLGEWQGVPSRCALLGSFAICDNSVNAKCERVLVLALCLVTVLMDMSLLFQRLVAVNLVIKFVRHSDNFGTVR